MEALRSSGTLLIASNHAAKKKITAYEHWSMLLA
jgi:hypothetical protein